MSANFLTDAPCCRPTVVQGDSIPYSMLQMNVVWTEFICILYINSSNGIKCGIIAYNDKHVHHSKHINAHSYASGRHAVNYN